MAVLFNVMAKAGEYTNKSGEKKTRWHRCGVAIEAKNDAGMALIIESMPVNFDGWFQMFKPEEKTAGNNQSNNVGTPEIPEGDIPF
jgi:hypothetical protein